MPQCCALNSVRWPATFWVEEMCFYELWFSVLNYIHYTAHLESPARPKNHLTDISKRKLNVIFFNCILFISIYFFSLLLEKPDGNESRVLSLTLVPFGNKGRTFLAAVLLTHWLEVMTGLSRFWGKLLERSGVQFEAHSGWGGEVRRVGTVQRLTLASLWSGLPQIIFDSVEMKLINITYDAVYFCVLLSTWVFCWGLSFSLGFVSIQKGPPYGRLWGPLQLFVSGHINLVSLKG